MSRWFKVFRPLNGRAVLQVYFRPRRPESGYPPGHSFGVGRRASPSRAAGGEKKEILYEWIFARKPLLTKVGLNAYEHTNIQTYLVETIFCLPTANVEMCLKIRFIKKIPWYNAIFPIFEFLLTVAKVETSVAEHAFRRLLRKTATPTQELLQHPAQQKITPSGPHALRVLCLYL